MRLWRDLPTVYLHRDPVDFRKSIDGLAAIVEQQMGLDPFSDALYVFCNRHRDRLKVLYWDQTGYCLWYKRLEQAKFQWPRKHADGVIRWGEREFNWLLEGFVKRHLVLRIKTTPTFTHSRGVCWPVASGFLV